MSDIGDPTFATGMIRAIEERIDGSNGNYAKINRYIVTIVSVNYTTMTAGVYLQGSTTESSGFNIRSASLPTAGDLAVVCINGQERWVESVLGGHKTLSGRGYQTSNTGSSDSSKWTKIATGSISSQYQNPQFTLLFVGNGSGAAQHQRGILSVRVKQQAAFGSQPSVTVNTTSPVDVAQNDWILIVTSVAGPTTFELWFRNTISYTHLWFQPIHLDTSSQTVQFYSNQGYSSSLPAGTQYAGADPAFEGDLAYTGGMYAGGFTTNGYPTPNSSTLGQGVLELRSTNPFIDFSTDGSMDYGARIIYNLSSSGKLQFYGNAEFMGGVYLNTGDLLCDSSFDFFTRASAAQFIKAKSILLSTSFADPTPPDSGIQFGADVSLYRSGVNILHTPDTLTSSNMYACRVNVAGGSGSVTSTSITGLSIGGANPRCFPVGVTTVPGVVDYVSSGSTSAAGSTIYMLRSGSTSTGIDVLFVGGYA